MMPLLGNVAWISKNFLRSCKIYPWRCITTRWESVSTYPCRPLSGSVKKRGWCSRTSSRFKSPSVPRSHHDPSRDLIMIRSVIISRTVSQSYHDVSRDPIMIRSMIISRIVSWSRSRFYRSSAERTAPPSSTHVQLGDVPRLLDPARCRGSRWVPSARRRGDGDGEVIPAGLRLSSPKIWPRL